MGLLDAFADPQFRKDVVRGLLDAGNRGAVAGLLGGPVDTAALALGLLGYKNDAPVGGSEWIGQKMQNLGLVSEKRNPLAEGLAAFAGPMAAQQIAPKVFAAELRAMENMAKPSPMNAATHGQAGAIVWHGSPHKFDKFDSSKIGTGEGAQAYGHGLYLAESPDVAKTYQALDPVALSAPVRAFKGAELQSGTPEYHAATLLDNMGLQQARKQVSEWIATADPRMAREVEGWRKTLDTLNQATSKADFKRLKNTGSLYKVDLPDDQIARMLDWDKPLSQQAPEVQAAMSSALVDRGITKSVADYIVANKSGNEALATLSRGAYDARLNVPDGAMAADASRRLQQAGIPGIRYLDGGSRGAGAGTSNYVVFPGNEDLLRILERNGVPLP